MKKIILTTLVLATVLLGSLNNIDYHKMAGDEQDYPDSPIGTDM